MDSNLRTFVLAAVAAACLQVLPSASAQTAPPPSTSDLQVIELVNVYRLNAGLVALGWDERLYEAAYAHSFDMATNHCFQHDSCDGTPWNVRIALYYPSTGIVADLIGAGFPSASSMVDAWMGSDPHRAVLLSPQARGAGASSYQTYWTLDLGSLAPVPEPATWGLMAFGLAVLALRRGRTA